MKRRMKQLSLLLAGAALCLGVRISAIEASQPLEKNPTAGASRIFADIVKENEESGEAMLAAQQYEEDELMLAAVTEEADELCLPLYRMTDRQKMCSL